MATIEVTVESGLSAAAALVGGPEVTFGEWLESPDGVQFLIRQKTLGHSFGVGEMTLDILVKVAGTVTASVIARWLFKGTSKRRNRVYVNRREITEYTEEGFRHVIEEAISVEHEEQK